jgi:hypothetical protein
MGQKKRNWSALFAVLLGLSAAGWFAYEYFSNAALRSPHAARMETPVEDGAAAPLASPGLDSLPASASHKEKASARSKAVASLPERETLEYTGNVSKLSNVAALRVVIADRVDFLGRSVIHVQAFARTQNPLRMIFALDDRFDSYLDPKSLISLQFELHLNERGQKVDSVLRLTTGNEPAPSDATAARVLPGTRDPLGLLQYLRSVNWAKTPEVRCPVFDGHKLYEARARVTSPAETVEVPAGIFSASQIELRVFENGVEPKDTHFELYLANNAARTPVLLNAVLPFADARVELLRVQ